MCSVESCVNSCRCQSAWAVWVLWLSQLILRCPGDPSVQPEMGITSSKPHWMQLIASHSSKVLWVQQHENAGYKQECHSTLII